MALSAEKGLDTCSCCIAILESHSYIIENSKIKHSYFIKKSIRKKQFLKLKIARGYHYKLQAKIARSINN